MSDPTLHEAHYRKVRTFHDRDAAAYAQHRYGAETIQQLSYRIRRELTTGMMKEVSGDILDVGSGPGTFVETLCRSDRRVYAIDLSLKMLMEARRQAHDRARPFFALVSNLVQLGVRAGAFDGIICIGVIGYVPEPGPALGELYRVLKPGGVAVLQTSNACALKELVYESWLPRLKQLRAKDRKMRFDFPVRGYGRRTFDRMVAGAGFEILDRQFYDFHIPFLERLRMSWAIATALRLQRLSGAHRFGFLGSGYLLKVRKP